MGTITDKLNKLAETKSAIKTAIVNKGVSISDSDTFASYADKIGSIEGGSSLPDAVFITSNGLECPEINPDAEYPMIFSMDDNCVKFTDRIITLNTTSLTGLFRHFSNPNKYNAPSGNLTLIFPNVTNIKYLMMGNASTVINRNNPFNLTIIASSKLTEAQNMFSNWQSGDNQTVTLSNFGNVTSFNGTFRNCNDVSHFYGLDTSSATDFRYMFYSSQTKTIPELDTSKGTDFRYMFYECSSLTSIQELDTSRGTNFSSIFDACVKLIKVASLSLKSLNSTISNTYFTGYGARANLRYVLIKDFGTGSGCTSASFTYWPKWGIEDETIPLSAGARQSVIDTLITYSYDRATAGYSTCTITLHANTKALLTEDEIAQITAKGYTLA